MEPSKCEARRTRRLLAMFRHATFTCALQVAVVTNASATECVSFQLCSRFDLAAAVFVGRVVSIVEPKLLEPAVVEFVVVEAFKGVNDAVLTVEEPDRSRRLVHRFRVGETYLVFAYRHPGSGTLLAGGECSNSQRLDGAEEAVAYARRIARLPPGTGGRVDGVVRREERREFSRHSSTPLAGVHVTLQGDRRSYDAMTNSRGEFSIRNVVPGSYLARAHPPKNHEADHLGPVRVWDPVGCGRLYLSVRFDNRVSGRLLLPDGRPAAGRPVSLAPERFVKVLVHRYGDGEWKQSWTDAQGRFELRTVPADKYLLRVDTIPGDTAGFLFYRGKTLPTSVPDDGTRIDVRNRKRTALPNIVVPEEPSLVTLSAVVKAEDGTPVQDAETKLIERTQVGPTFRTGADGRFTFAAIKGRSYTLAASHFRRSVADYGTTSEGRLHFRAAPDVHLELVLKAKNP